MLLRAVLKEQFITPEFTRNLLWSYKKQQYHVIRSAVDYNCNNWSSICRHFSFLGESYNMQPVKKKYFASYLMHPSKTSLENTGTFACQKSVFH